MEADYIKESLKIKGFLDELLANQESSEVEFKSAKGGFPGSFWETYSSFANTNGGVVIFGVREKHGIFSVDPLNEVTILDFKKKFSDLQHDREKISLPLLTDKDVVCEPNGDGYILAFFIPRATRDQRPVYVGLDPMTGTYRRDHEGDYRCEPSTVSQMFADRKNSEVLQEAKILPNYSWDDIDLISFRQYRTLFTNLTPSHPWTVLEDLELMKKLGGYRKDRVTGDEGFTLAGILMFGKTEAITDVACLPDFMLDYRDIPQDTSKTRWTDRIYPDGTWECNLFQFYRRVLPKLHAFLPKPFVLKGDERQEDTPTHEAVREAFINLCVHASYSRSPRLVIEKRPDGIVMRNPGTLLISIPQYYEGGHSECRNPSLQKMFGLIGRSDKAGSGVDKIMEGWKYAKWRRPYISEKSHPDVVELYLPLESLVSDTTITELKNIFGESVVGLPHNEIIILSMAVSDEDVSNASLQNAVDLHPSDLSKLLRKMCKDGLLIASGFGRGTTYRLNRSNVASSDVASPYTTIASVANSYALSSDVASSDVASSDVASSDVASSMEQPVAHSDDENVITMIKDVCRHQWLSSKNISLKIGRHPTHVRRIIKKMLQNGDLKQEFPNQPTHPAQRYHTT